MTHCMVSVGAVFVTLIMATASYGAVVFVDDFEDGNLTGWTVGGRREGTNVANVVTRNNSKMGHLYHASMTEIGLTSSTFPLAGFHVDLDFELRASGGGGSTSNFYAMADVVFVFSGPQNQKAFVTYYRSTSSFPVKNSTWPASGPNGKWIAVANSTPQSLSLSGSDLLTKIPQVPDGLDSVYIWLNTYASAWDSSMQAELWVDNVVMSSRVPTVWNVDGTGSWGVDANWSNGIPSGPAAIASFLDKLTAGNAPAEVLLDGSKTVGRVMFDNANSYNVIGSGDSKLTLDDWDVRAEVSVLNGSHSIAAPIITVKGAVVSVGASGRLTTPRGFKAASNAAVTKEGEGIWDVSEGISLGTSGSLVVNAGIVSTDNIRGGSLAVHSGGTVVLKQGGTGVSVLTGLTLDGTPGNWEGLLDLADNDLIVQADASTVQATLDRITSQIIAARDSKLGRWAGEGITSSVAEADASGFTGLAAIRNIHRFGGTFFGFFDDQPVDANSILMKYTWNGDANLDGVVNFDDYHFIDAGFITQNPGYQNGDFNYDGVVNADDYFLIDSAFIGQSGKLSAGVRPIAVPEASGLAVAVFGALGLVRWCARREAR